MAEEYSLYDAKANLSKIVKQVRESGSTVVITVHGEPAVEIRPYKELPLKLEQRIAALTARGDILPAQQASRDYVFKPRTGKTRGGLKRFLAERNED